MSTTTSVSTDSEITPEALAQRLIFDGCGLESLVEDCQMEAELLAKLLYSRQFQDHLKLRIDLAIACAKIRAAETLPDCVEILQELTESKKPEVARRSAMTLLHIAGLPTQPAPPQPKAPPPAPAPLPTPAPTPPEPTPSPANTTQLNPDAPQLPITSYQLPSPPAPNINQNPNDSALFTPSLAQEGSRYDPPPDSPS